MTPQLKQHLHVLLAWVEKQKQNGGDTPQYVSAALKALAKTSAIGNDCTYIQSN